jgi:hypothetical protein
MADRLNVTDLDFDQIKSNLKTFLKQQTEFQDYDFDGSGMSVLLDVLAYNTHYNAYYLNMVANESFLETAMLRNSVVSHAKSMGYTPRSAVAPRAIVRVVIETGSATAGSLTIPRGYTFLSNQIENQAYTFVTKSSVTVTKTGTQYIFNNLPIYEGKALTYDYVHSVTSNPKRIFTIPDSNIDTSTLTVSVRESESNTQVTVYTKSDDALSVTSTSEVYFLQEGNDGKYEVYFGDGVIGKTLADGSVVSLGYLTTNATAANKANNFVATSTLSGFSNITVDPISAAAGGALRETVDEIKYAAPLSLLSQNRAITKNDYIRLIQQKYPSFDAVNVWGGEEQSPPVYGKVFVSAKPKLGFEITQTEKDYVKQNILKPISMLTITPEIVDVDYNYLKINSTVYYDKTKTTLSDNELKSAISTVITNYSNTNLNKFNSYFKYSGLETAVDAYSSAIVSNEIELFVAKKFRPVLGSSDNYVLDFGFEIKRGSTNDSFYSSPDFTMVDETGVSRQCFFEEIPSSFTGVESISVTIPGYNYTSTPTVEIIGDGTGATAVANIVNGKLSSVTVLTPGIGYTTAAVRITGGGGTLAEATAVLEGRYGQLRISYYKTDEVSSQSTKVVINQSKNNGVAGTIDYKLGKIYINDFSPTAVNNDFGDISLHIIPTVNIIQSKLNKMLVLDVEDPTSITVKTIQI